MTAPQGPCTTWPVIWPCDVSSEPVTGVATATAVASQILWALTGRQFGECQVTIRPCRRTCDDWATPWGVSEWAYGGPVPALIGGLWYNFPCGLCGFGACSCTMVEEVLLPAPVLRIVQVKIDGTPMVTGSYRVDDSRLLVRTDGGRWPICQNLTASDTVTGTWSVTVGVGKTVPEVGQMAMGELACEVLKALKGQDCRLPRQVTQLARQGVTINFPDPTDLLKKGKLGLYISDMFIQSVNPSGLPSRSRVYSVDRPKWRRAGT